MARAEITFFMAGNRSLEGGTMPVPLMQGMTTEALTIGTASVATTFASGAPDGTGFVRVTAEADVWVATGTSPVAAVPAAGDRQPGLRVKAGQPTDLAVASGSRVAIVSAA